MNPKPCPCKCGTMPTLGTMRHNDEYFYLSCGECYRTGPYFLTRKEAFEDWNNTFGRASISAETGKMLAEKTNALLNWAERLRASGDAGNWDWSHSDEYTEAKSALAAYEQEKKEVV